LCAELEARGSLLDRLPEEERALYLSDFAPTLAACAAAAG
jgi:hypothetical protein